MAAIIQASKGILQTVLWLSTIFGLALIGGGAWLVYLGATGDTELQLFGNSLKASSVGAVGIFCGAVVVGVIFRRTLKTLEHMAGTDHMFEK